MFGCCADVSIIINTLTMQRVAFFSSYKGSHSLWPSYRHLRLHHVTHTHLAIPISHHANMHDNLAISACNPQQVPRIISGAQCRYYILTHAAPDIIANHVGHVWPYTLPPSPIYEHKHASPDRYVCISRLEFTRQNAHRLQHVVTSTTSDTPIHGFTCTHTDIHIGSRMP